MSDTPTPLSADSLREPLKLTVTCGNCYQDAEVGMFTIGKDIYDFYKRHKTRIGRTFCSMDAICVRYDPIVAALQAERQRIADSLEARQHVYNVKSTDGVLNEPDTGVVAVPVDAVRAVLTVDASRLTSKGEQAAAEERKGE